MQTKNKLLSTIILLIVIAPYLTAQNITEFMAFGGPTGIFINLGNDIPSKGVSQSYVSGYKIARKIPGGNNWQEIASTSGPDGFDDFYNRIISSNSLLKDSISISELPLKIIWEKVQKSKRFDSLRYFGNPLVVRLALGVCYLDKNVNPDARYIYKVSKLDQAGKEIDYFTTPEIFFPPIREKIKTAFYSKENESRFIKITWNVLEGNNPARFKAFRKENFKNNFNEIFPVKLISAVNGKPSVSIIDTLVHESSVYQYYLTPVYYYQNEGTSSDTVVAVAFNFSSLIPPYKMSVKGLDSLGALELRWRQDQANKLVSLKVFRSRDYDKDYTAIAEVPGSDTFYVDRTAEPMIKYYYYLQLNDQFGETAIKSAKVFGIYKSSSIPPPPMNLRPDYSKKDVRLIWEKPDAYVNTYRIYKGLIGSRSLTEFSSVFSADSLVQFVDTNNSTKRSGFYYYAVRSENTSGNMSPFSDTIQIMYKSSASLNVPLNLKGYAEDSKVILYWENLFKSDPSIDGYKIYRRLKSNGNAKPFEFRLVVDSLLPPKQNNFTDTSASFGMSYEYAVKAFTIYGTQSSFSSPLLINIPDKTVLAPAGITAESNNDGILITWQAPLQQDLKEFKIFRYQRGENPALIGTVKSGETPELLDKQVQDGKLYFYFLKTVSSKNLESSQSSEVGVRK